jgi:hypothetical protein
MKYILYVITLTGVLMWNMPASNSLFSGEHTFYNGSAPCEKCHIEEIDAELHTGTLNHTMGCRVCHPRDGNSSHSAERGTCYDCHGDLWNTTVVVDNVTDVSMETGTPIVNATVSEPIQV